jgi:hypothetical protein
MFEISPLVSYDGEGLEKWKGQEIAVKHIEIERTEKTMASDTKGVEGSKDDKVIDEKAKDEDK